MTLWSGHWTWSQDIQVKSWFQLKVTKEGCCTNAILFLPQYLMPNGYNIHCLPPLVCFVDLQYNPVRQVLSLYICTYIDSTMLLLGVSVIQIANNVTIHREITGSTLLQFMKTKLWRIDNSLFYYFDQQQQHYIFMFLLQKKFSSRNWEKNLGNSLSNLLFFSVYCQENPSSQCLKVFFLKKVTHIKKLIFDLCTELTTCIK